MDTKSTPKPLVKLTEHTYVLGDGTALVTFSTAYAEDFDKGKVQKVTPPGGGQQIEIMSWGADNDLPQKRELLVTENNIVPALIERKRNILVGNGLMAYTERFETGADGKLKKITEEVEMPSVVAEWMEAANFEQYLNDAAGELVKHGLVVPEYVRDRAGHITSVEVKPCKYVRAGKKDDAGKISSWFWSGFWGTGARKSQIEKAKTVALEVYAGEEAKQPKFIVPLGDYLFNDGYYPIPSWWGSWEWIELANEIPQFHKSNLLNGYNIRWHIQIPHDYFLDYESYNQADTEADKITVLNTAGQKEQAFLNNLNDVLAGKANAGRTVVTKYELDRALGKEYPGIKIEPLNFDMKDKALLDLFEKSNTANISAQGIHPSLANIQTQGQLSSGTEIRNAFLMWLIINTHRPRQMMLKPLELAKKVNNWPVAIKYAIRDYELTALSTDKSGMQPKTEATSGQ